MSTSVRAADITWTNGSSTYETNSNWSPSAVPTLNDRAIFSDSAALSGYTVTFANSETLADALFSATSKTVIWKVGNGNTWAITNSFVFDEGASGTATGVLVSGTITVTNATGTGAFKVGNSATGGRGLLKMELATSGATPPTLIVDQFTLTANSDFFFRAGTLTTLGGATINRGSQTGFCIGTNSTSTAGPAYWNMLGGSNTISYSSGGATYLGYNSSTFGSLKVSGSNTVLSVGGGTLVIGNTGQGALTINGGARVSSPELLMSRSSASANSSNVATVSGPGSRWDITSSLESSFGYQGGTNQTSILDGGVVVLNSTGSATLGNAAASSANRLTVSGANSLFQAGGALFVGINGSDNSLIVTNGGTAALVGSGSLTMGSSLQSTNNLVKVSGGSLLVNSATITVGNHGANNTLTLDNNGTVIVNGGNLYVSAQSDALNNSVVVSGGSLVVTNSGGGSILDVSHTASSTGSFTLNSGTVTVDRLLVSHGANSKFTFNGGVLNITGNVSSNSQINNGAAFAVGDGLHAATLNLASGSTFLVANGLQISTNAVLMGHGIVSGNTTSYGTVSPGHSADTLVFAGDLKLTPNSVLAMEIGGTSSGQFDQIIMSNGGLTVNGTLSISLIGGFTPANGDSFQLLNLASCTSTSGVFAGFSLPSLDGGLSWDTSELLVTGSLNVVPEPSSLALVIGGCGLLAWLGNRRRSRRQEPQSSDF